MSLAAPQTARMRSHLRPSDPARDPHSAEQAELAASSLFTVGAAAALVGGLSLVALTQGWDYRLAVMLGTILAAALARARWRALPAARVADRLVAAFAGTFAAGLFCVYASDWLDWRPLGVDDAVAGTTVGLLLLAVPVRRLLQHASNVPVAAGLAVVLLALAPAVWAVLVYVFHSDGLDRAAGYALIEAPGFGAALAVAGLGFVFALRRRLYPAAMVLSPVAWLEVFALVSDGGASVETAMLAGGIAGVGLMIASTGAWVRSARGASGGPNRVRGSAGGMALGAFLAGPVRRALGATVRAPSAVPVALVALAAAPAAWAMFGPNLHDVWPKSHNALMEPTVLMLLVAAVLAFALARHRRLYRTALVGSALVGAGLFLFLERVHIETATAAYLGVTVGACMLLATSAAWRAHVRGAAVRPGGLLAFLAFASTWALIAGIEPLDWFAAAAALGVWWWFNLRRGAPLVGPVTGRRQLPLRAALVGAFSVTLGVHLVLLDAAVMNHTGPMLLADLRARGIYTVSDLTFARAMLADQYLWRDSISPSRPANAAYPELLVTSARHERDRWSATGLAADRSASDAPVGTDYGMVTDPDTSGGVRIVYVYGGSPAHAAGLRRGELIRAADGVALDRPGAHLPLSDGAVHLEVVTPGGDVRTVTIARAEYPRSAVGPVRVIEEAGRRIAYLELHHFLAAADEDFVNAAARLREQGIDELVLDLRMNAGGYLGRSLRVASAIGGARLDGRVFKRIEHNDRYRDRDRGLSFSAPARGALSLPRVFIITSDGTCSASESLINGLAPHMPVVTVGATTCGKPVGSLPLDYGERAFSIITFRGSNARGEGEYYAGLRPTCTAEDDVSRDLGDPAEGSFRTALYYIRYGRCPGPAADAWDAL